ncbi:MAG: hypothetical protein ABI634_14015 [Acidobacteriota bacterium]
MAFAPGKIHLGMARIFVGVTAAATGTPPTYTTHTAGVPGSGAEVGLTQGDTSFTYKAEKKYIEAEQGLGYVQAFTVSERAAVECTMLEQTYITLQQAFDNVGKESVGAGDAFWFGGGTAILTPTQQCVMFTALDPINPTKYRIVQLYKVSMPNGMEIPFSRTKESVYKVRFEGLQDLTRNAADQMGYYRIEK